MAGKSSQTTEIDRQQAHSPFNIFRQRGVKTAVGAVEMIDRTFIEWFSFETLLEEKEDSFLILQFFFLLK